MGINSFHMKKYLLYSSFLLLFLIGCNSNDSKNISVSINSNLPEVDQDSLTENTDKSNDQYDLKNPTHTWELPKSLLEISGNTWVDKNHVLLIDDEHPILFLFEIKDKELVLDKTIPFQEDKKGKLDIEGVTIVNDIVYAVGSNGILFKITDWNSKLSVEKINTSLKGKNNTGGLCYDPVTNHLLIACKEDSGIKGADKSTKVVYQFDMVTEKIVEEPFLIFDKKTFEKLVGKQIAFHPSAIAVHPVSKNIHLLSTRDNKCMAVFNRSGTLISFQFIDEELIPQPEGICFSPDGKMYISSEGRAGEPGKLFEFEKK